MFIPSIIAEIAPRDNATIHNYLVSSPCKRRPDTDMECYRLYSDKKSGECLNCKWIGCKSADTKPSVVKINRNTCRFIECEKTTIHPSHLCVYHRELVRKRRKRWHKKNKTDAPESYLFEPPGKKEWGNCEMEGCKEKASRTLKDFGIPLCKGHHQTAYSRVVRAHGEISIAEIIKEPNRSQSRRKKK